MPSVKIYVDETEVFVPADVGTMILALVDCRADIHKRGSGTVLLHYHGSKVSIAHSTTNFRMNARPAVKKDLE
jgi:hypothetical protein